MIVVRSPSNRKAARSKTSPWYTTWRPCITEGCAGIAAPTKSRCNKCRFAFCRNVPNLWRDWVERAYVSPLRNPWTDPRFEPDAPASVREAERARIDALCAWVDSQPPARGGVNPDEIRAEEEALRALEREAAA